jgi:hypothetical protein
MLDNKYTSWLEELFQPDEKPYLQNQEALNYLKHIQVWYNAAIIASGGTLLTGAVAAPPIGLVGGIVSLPLIDLSKRVDRLVSVIEELLKIDGITVTPSVTTLEGTIDLLVKMPDKRCFAFALKSNKDSQVKWREDQQEFFVVTRRKGKPARIKKWSDLIKTGQNLNTRTLSLKKEKSYLLAGSKNVITKAIVLTSETRLYQDHDRNLFVKFGRTEALRVHAGSYMYVLDQAKIIDFLAPVEKS